MLPHQWGVEPVTCSHLSGEPFSFLVPLPFLLFEKILMVVIYLFDFCLPSIRSMDGCSLEAAVSNGGRRPLDVTET